MNKPISGTSYLNLRGWLISEMLISLVYILPMIIVAIYILLFSSYFNINTCLVTIQHYEVHKALLLNILLVSESDILKKVSFPFSFNPFSSR